MYSLQNFFSDPVSKKKIKTIGYLAVVTLFIFLAKSIIVPKKLLPSISVVNLPQGIGSQFDGNLQKITAPSVRGFSSSVYTGDSTISYPIASPPAAGGFLPSLALSYSSGSVEDMRIGTKDEDWQNKFTVQGSNIGMGWSLSGIPDISKTSSGKYFLSISGRSFELVYDEKRTRESATGYYDYKNDFEGNDACKRAVYRTEPESYIKIVRPQFGTRSCPTEMGTNWDVRDWDIWTQDGTYYHFSRAGYHVVKEHFNENCVANGINYQRQTFKNRSSWNRWVATEADDTNGNKITYAFDSESKEIDGDCNACGQCWGFGGQNPTYKRAIYPKEIKYGKDLQNKIVLNYTPREDYQIEKYNDRSVNNFYSTKRLDKIDVYLGNSLLKSYKLNPSYSDAPSNWGDGETHGRLQLASISVLDKEGNAYPVSQSYEYYPRTSSSRFLLKKADNGYGGIVEYEYDVGWVNANLEVGYYVYGASQKRNRVRTIKTISNFAGDYQKTVYDYPATYPCSETIQKNCNLRNANDGQYCPNAHAVSANEFFDNFEFLGYHVVKSTLYTKEAGSNSEKQDLSTVSIFNQGTDTTEQVAPAPGQEEWPCVTKFRPLANKGTQVKTIIINPTNQLISIQEDDHIIDKNHNNFTYLKESRSCSDLDIPDTSLRRGSKTTFEYEHPYGNSIKSQAFEVSNCSYSGADQFSWKINFPSNPTLYRQNLATYAHLDIDNADPTKVKYIVNKEITSSLTDSAGKRYSLNWNFYDNTENNLIGKIISASTDGGPVNKGLLTASFTVDVTDLYRSDRDSDSFPTINQKVSYDNFGNRTSSIAYGDYGQVTVQSLDPLKFRVDKLPADSRVNSIAYDSSFQVFPTSVTNPLNQTSKTDYNFSLGLPQKVTDPNNIWTEIRYDSFGRIKKAWSIGDDENNPLDEYQYYDNKTSEVGTPFAVKIAKKEAYGIQAENGLNELIGYFFYDDLGRKLQSQTESSQNGKLFADKAIYDAKNEIIKTIPGQEVAGTFGKYLPGLPEDLAITTDYDLLGRTIRKIDADNTCSLIKYEGQKTTTFDQLANAFSSRVDNLNRAYKSINFKKQNPTTSVNCQSGAVNYPEITNTSLYKTYTTSENSTNILDQVTKMTIKDGSNKVLSESTISYDAFGRTVQIFDPDLGFLCFGRKTNNYFCSPVYDALGNNLVKTDKKGQVFSYNYDKVSRLIESFLGEGANKILQSKSEYDNPAYGAAIGKIVKETTPNLLEKTYSYNSNGFLEKSSIKLLSGDSINGTKEISSTFTYDALKRLKTSTFSPNFDSSKQAETLTSNYDSGEKLINVVSNLGINYIDKITYDKYGLIQSRQFANNTKEHYCYDPKTLQLKFHEVLPVNANFSVCPTTSTCPAKNPNSLLSLCYAEYDKVGNLTKKVNVNSSEESKYFYDDLYRLTGVQGAYSASYEYDELGRMTKKQEGDQNLSLTFSNFQSRYPLTSFPLNAPKTVTLQGGTTGKPSNISYDKNGNLISYDNKNLVYDQYNRLIQAKNSSGQSIAAYQYDSSGQRITATLGETKTIYLTSVEAEISPTSLTVKQYLPGGALKLYTFDKTGKLTDNKLYYSYSDYLSSVEVIADNTGKNINANAFDYFPYGTRRDKNALVKTNIRVSFGDIDKVPVSTIPEILSNRLFTGQIYDGDNTGLYYYGARYYDPYLGVFTSADYVEGPNRYAYVNGNPIMKNDPTGNASVDLGDGISYDTSQPINHTNPIISISPANMTNYSPLSRSEVKQRRDANILNTLGAAKTPEHISRQEELLIMAGFLGAFILAPIIVPVIVPVAVVAVPTVLTVAGPKIMSMANNPFVQQVGTNVLINESTDVVDQTINIIQGDQKGWDIKQSFNVGKETILTYTPGVNVIYQLTKLVKNPDATSFIDLINAGIITTGAKGSMAKEFKEARYTYKILDSAKKMSDDAVTNKGDASSDQVKLGANVFKANRDNLSTLTTAFRSAFSK